MTVLLNNKQFVWVNLLWFQAIWFIAVIYTQSAPALLMLSLCLHFILTTTRRADLFSMIAITFVGCLADYMLTLLGIFIFATKVFIPFWLVLLWSHFALSLNHSMQWLSRCALYVQILFGAIFGTLSYYAGSQFGAVRLHSNLTLSLISLSIMWASLLPVYIYIAKQSRLSSEQSYLTKN